MIGDAGFLALGLLAGTLHFALLRWNTALYLRAGGFWRAVLAQVLRLCGIAGALALAALHGVLPLLLAALGALIARPLVMRWTAPEP